MSTTVNQNIMPTPPPPVNGFETAMDAWLEERRSFIGGSEMFELFNLPQYGKGCARTLAYRKRGDQPDYADERDEALLRRGNILEPLAATLYEEKTGRKVRRPAMNEWGLPRVQRHPDYPGVGIHTDRFILAGSADVKDTGDLELKTHGEGPYLGALRRGIAPGYSLQVAASNLVTNHKWGSFAMLGVFGGLPMEFFDIPRDEAIVDDIKRRADGFWSGLAKGELPERLANADDTRCKVCQFRMTCRGEELDRAAMANVQREKAGKEPLVHIASFELAADLAARDIIKAEIKALTNDSVEHPGALEVLEEKIMLQLGDTQAAFVESYGKVYAKPGTYTGVDVARLKADDVYDKYKITNPTARGLRTYPAKSSVM